VNKVVELLLVGSILFRRPVWLPGNIKILKNPFATVLGGSLVPDVTLGVSSCSLMCSFEFVASIVFVHILY